MLGNKWRLLARVFPNKISLKRTFCSLGMDTPIPAQALRGKNAFLIDCDGVLYHDNEILPGVPEFITFLMETNKKYLFLTNASDKTVPQLQQKFKKLFPQMEISADHFYTSAQSTAAFVSSQKPKATAYVVGEESVKIALQEEGISVMTKEQVKSETPDFVVIGETFSNQVYNFEAVALATSLVLRGSRLIGTNKDHADRMAGTLVPGTGALVSSIEKASGQKAYFLGKPNPLMVETGIKKLGASRSEVLFVGDRMDTDIRAGVEASVDTILVLSGVTDIATMKGFAFRPKYVLDGVGQIPSLF